MVATVRGGYPMMARESESENRCADSDTGNIGCAIAGSGVLLRLSDAF